MSFLTRAARRAAVAAIAIAAIGADLAPANAATFALPRFPQPTPARSSMFSGPFAGANGIAAWTRLHTEAPSQFHAPIGGLASLAAARRPVGGGFFNGPAAGPVGAQFGRLPGSNASFINPTRNASQARQTQNAQQATNTQMSGNAVQGRNCYRNAILAGLCQRP